MDYFNNVLTTFLGLERGSCVAEYEVLLVTHIFKTFPVYTADNSKEILKVLVPHFLWCLSCVELVEPIGG